MAKKLFCFGLGYSATALARRLQGDGWQVAGTCRTPQKCEVLKAEGIDARVFDGSQPIDGLEQMLSGVTHVLSSIPPRAPQPASEPGSGVGQHTVCDPVIAHHYQDLMVVSGLQWLGYLSTTGVYGDTAGAEVDEDSPLNPTSDRGRHRVEAEAAWLTLHRERGLAVHVFRLAGIYGPGRSVLDQVRENVAKCIDKPDHRFSRIHRDDIVETLMASIARPDGGAVYNVCDDLPAPQAAVVTHASRLLGKPAPPLIPFDEAAKTMSPMALSFWRDNRRVSNRRIKEVLGVKLHHPTFREGLEQILRHDGS